MRKLPKSKLRKGAFFTLAPEATKLLSRLSKQAGMSRSRLVELLILHADERRALPRDLRRVRKDKAVTP